MKAPKLNAINEVGLAIFLSEIINNVEPVALVIGVVRFRFFVLSVTTGVVGAKHGVCGRSADGCDLKNLLAFVFPCSRGQNHSRTLLEWICHGT